MTEFDEFDEAEEKEIIVYEDLPAEIKTRVRYENEDYGEEQ
jgi:hypothetical protein